jgi:hypothetical protein
MAPCYRSLRQVKKKCRNLKRTHTKAHPEKGGRSPEARIYAADIWADPGTEGVAMANSEKAMAEGLKYNIVPDFVYYVDVNYIERVVWTRGSLLEKRGWAHQSPQLGEPHGACHVGIPCRTD